MILDSVNNLGQYKGLSKNLDRAIDYISENDLSVLPVGKNEIYGDDVFVIINEYKTKNESDCIIETHKKYIDIQIMLKGDEMIGFAVLANQDIKIPYDDKKDCVFYSAELDYQHLRQGNFAIFMPTDLHSPSIKIDTPQSVVKAVVKVRIPVF